MKLAGLLHIWKRKGNSPPLKNHRKYGFCFLFHREACASFSYIYPNDLSEIHSPSFNPFLKVFGDSKET